MVTCIMEICRLMDFQTYNSLAMRTANKELNWIDTLVNASMGLAGEGGEVIDHIKKAKFHGHTIDTEKVALELGDCLFYINWIADSLGLDLEQVAEANITKLSKRYPDKFNSEASKNRVEYNAYVQAAQPLNSRQLDEFKKSVEVKLAQWQDDMNTGHNV